MSHMTLIDAGMGVSILLSGDSERQIAILKESHIYGETEALDCPADHNCYCKDKKALSLFGSNHGSKEYHISAASPYPTEKIKTYGTWASATDIYKVAFHNFKDPKTICGAN